MTTAYIISGGLDHFGMASRDGEPTKNDADLTNGESFLEEAHAFVEKYFKLQMTDIGDVTPRCIKLECLYCGKVYVKQACLRTHEREEHNHMEPEPTVMEEDGDLDRVLEYTKTVITMGLLRLEHNNALGLGDGARIMRVNKCLMPVYKTKEKGGISRGPKYAYAVLELMLQVQALLPPQLAYQLMWNRTVNHRGEAETNYPNDLDVEHCNKYFKGNV